MLTTVYRDKRFVFSESSFREVPDFDVFHSQKRGTIEIQFGGRWRHMIPNSKQIQTVLRELDFYYVDYIGLVWECDYTPKKYQEIKSQGFKETFWNLFETQGVTNES